MSLKANAHSVLEVPVSATSVLQLAGHLEQVTVGMGIPGICHGGQCRLATPDLLPAPLPSTSQTVRRHRSTSRAKYGEAYKQLQHAMVGARATADPQEVRMLCMAADWVHLKLLLYAIGSGNIGKDNVKHLHGQWRAHMRSFGAPLSAPPARLPLPRP